MIEPYPQWWIYDDSKTTPVWTELTADVRAHSIGYGCKLNWSTGRFRIAPANGLLRLRNDRGQFAYASRTWWSSVRSVRLNMGSARVWRGYVLPRSSEPLRADATVEWQLVGLTAPSMAQSRPWRQTDQSAAASIPNALLRRLLARYGLADPDDAQGMDTSRFHQPGRLAARTTCRRTGRWRRTSTNWLGLRCRYRRTRRTDGSCSPGSTKCSRR